MIEMIPVYKLLSVACIMGVPAVATAYSVSQIAGKFIEGCTRQPDMADKLKEQFIIGAALTELLPLCCIAAGFLALLS